MTKPARPTSATVLSSQGEVSGLSLFAGVPKPGALRTREASAALPKPPRPPAASKQIARAPTRSIAGRSRQYHGAFGTFAQIAPAARAVCHPLTRSRGEMRAKWKSAGCARGRRRRRCCRPGAISAIGAMAADFSRWTEAQPFCQTRSGVDDDPIDKPGTGNASSAGVQLRVLPS